MMQPIDNSDEDDLFAVVLNVRRRLQRAQLMREKGLRGDVTPPPHGKRSTMTLMCFNTLKLADSGEILSKGQRQMKMRAIRAIHTMSSGRQKMLPYFICHCTLNSNRSQDEKADVEAVKVTSQNI